VLEFDPLVLISVILVNVMMAYSQSVVLKAGVFSVATIGLSAVGAYLSGYLVTIQHWGTWPAAIAGVLGSVVFAGLLALPISRLRGTYASIASLAFVIIVQTAAQNLTPITGGANGLDGIPRLINWPGLLVVTVACILLLTAVYNSRIGIRFNMVRQDERVAVSQGVSVARTHFTAFVLSGLFAGIGGVCFAYYNYALFPDSFSFTIVTDVLAYVYLGGFRSWRGPLLGAIVVTALPEIFLPLASWSLIIDGGILILILSLLPAGVLDSVELAVRRRRSSRSPGSTPPGQAGRGAGQTAVAELTPPARHGTAGTAGSRRIAEQPS
jgi:branched-chain amino acid transport system permease protein